MIPSQKDYFNFNIFLTFGTFQKCNPCNYLKINSLYVCTSYNSLSINVL